MFVHLSGDDARAKKFFAPHGFAGVPRISDPEGKLYEEFGLVRAHWQQYINYQSIMRMLAAWLDGHWVGMPAGDVQRMPGVFLVVEGETRKGYRHTLVSDRPDYLALATVG